MSKGINLNDKAKCLELISICEERLKAYPDDHQQVAEIKSQIEQLRRKSATIKQ